MKTAAIFRIVLVAILSLFLIEYLAGASGKWAVVETPILMVVWLIIIFFMIAIEISVAAFQRLLFHTLSDEAKARYLASERKATSEEWLNKVYTWLVGKRKGRSEEEIILDHNYDGIRELDNNLPTWWVYGFYATIIFAVVYMARYHVFDGPTQEEEYRREVAAAQASIEEYRRTAKGLVDASTVVMLTDASDLQAGRNLYEASCAVCHRADGGGGIGPNLTDNYWILGGTINNIYEVISEGGRPGKGMIAWKNDLRPLEIAQVSSYILTLVGTNPPDAKEPEGDFVAPADQAEGMEEARENIDAPELSESEQENTLEIE